jgi:hypothetical protein
MFPELTLEQVETVVCAIRELAGIRSPAAAAAS